MHLLQVCNVGNICGGTAACAWEITRALPTSRHTVAFLSTPTDQTRTAFADCHIGTWKNVAAAEVRRLNPDVVVLHNTPSNRCESLEAPLTMQYLHSRITPAPADVTVACSRWLQDQYPRDAVDGVLYQPASVTPPQDHRDVRPLRDRIVVGRLCTPSARKWPREMIPIYRRLAGEHPDIEWEFVGCRRELTSELSQACGGRAAFHTPGPAARQRLWNWDAVLYHHSQLTESFGRIAAEAMSAGCIPIVNDRGGFREQITEECGFLCDGEDAFSAALKQLQDGSKRRQLARRSRVIAHKRFSQTAFAARFRALLVAAENAITRVTPLNRAPEHAAPPAELRHRCQAAPRSARPATRRPAGLLPVDSRATPATRRGEVR